MHKSTVLYFNKAGVKGGCGCGSCTHVFEIVCFLHNNMYNYTPVYIQANS